MLNAEYWVTKDGRQLRPEQFGDEHLINTIRLLEQNAPGMKDRAELECVAGESFVQGEMASYYLGLEAERYFRLTSHEFLQFHVPIYGKLVAEAERRGLEVEKGEDG